MWIFGNTELNIVGCLVLVLILGSIIGFERQWRYRMAGLRTNALVSVGSAAFASLSLLVDGEVSKTRIAVQVVSGIGFIGAGLILKEGASVRGLNTTATLWGLSVVGVTAGVGYPKNFN